MVSNLQQEERIAVTPGESISMQQGQRISLSQTVPNLKKIMCGLGWDIPSHSPGGLFGGHEEPSNCDLDASVICLDADGAIDDQENIVYFGNLKHQCGGITHLGDNKTGAGIGDDEQIVVELGKIPPAITKLVFTVSIYECSLRQQDFGRIENAYVRLVDAETDLEFARYNLSGQGGITGMIMAEIYREGDDWYMEAIGKGVQVNGIEELVRSYAV
jgi:stress response protein SCP2